MRSPRGTQTEKTCLRNFQENLKRDYAEAFFEPVEDTY